VADVIENYEKIRLFGYLYYHKVYKKDTLKNVATLFYIEQTEYQLKEINF